MQIISYIFIGYLVGVVLTGGRLGWHMTFRLDRFDWQYSKFQIWVSFVISSLLWPLMLRKARNLIDPTNLFEDGFGVAARKREEASLWSNPPPCGSLILYRQGHGRHEETFGEFTFHSVDIEEALVDILSKNAHLAKDQEGMILNWLRQRNDSITVPTVVPNWSRFQFIADDVLRNGFGEIHCLRCNKQIPNSQLLEKDDHGMPGWNFNRLMCPNDHQLLVVENMHLLMGS